MKLRTLGRLGLLAAVLPLATVLALATATAGCLTSFTPPAQQTCTVDEDCPVGMGCAEVMGLCLERCSESTNCPDLAYRCEAGLCLPVVGAECAAHGDCDAPGVCEVSGDASCIEGQCAYGPVVCDAPPARECSADDTTIRVWASVGTCAATGVGPAEGQCEYGHTDVPCPGCTVSCLEQDPCETVTCPDASGGCQVHGVCLPTSPPTCQYDDAPVNTPCDRQGSPAGALDGFCDAGLCGTEVPVPCEENSECALRTCIAKFCRPVAGFQGICDAGDDGDCGPALECAGGVCLRAAGEACQVNGDCAGTCIGLVCAPVSGATGPCDAAGGGDDDDCQAALNCNSGVCETGLACVDNTVCLGSDVCIGGYCRSLAATGGVCDAGQDGDCVAGHACVGGVCLRVNGEACSSNSQCVNVCIALSCDDPGGTREPCDTADGAADCQAGRTCAAGLCLLLDGQGGCTADDQCVNTCISGTCGPRVGTGLGCDSAGDCLAGHACTGGVCLRSDGQGCTANSQCVNVCLGGLCGATSGTLGPCDVADGDADCQASHDCVGGMCLSEDGQSCISNTQCVHTCIGGGCAPLSGTGGSCDAADGDADCLGTHACVGGQCLLDNGQACTQNSQCANTCISQICAALSGLGGACDDAGDCTGGYACIGLQCAENGIARIRIQGTGGSGGGAGPVGWSLVDEVGADQGAVSAGWSQPLYQDIDWTVDLDTVLVNGDFFALMGDEGSSAVTRTFTFYDGFDTQIDQVVIGPVDAGRIVRTPSSNIDYWVRFYFDGVNVTWTQFHKPIARIRVTGTATSAGGGANLSGYYRVSSTGANQGQLSPGHNQTLYQTSSWEVTLTTPILEGFEFALVGNEGSEAITRTFTFLDALGSTIGTRTVNSTMSNDIIRISTWGTSDTYIHFDYNGGVVGSVSRTTP